MSTTSCWTKRCELFILSREEQEDETNLKVRNVQVPIGVPVHNCIAYVLDSQLEPVEEGGVGALYISSRNLGRGYTGAQQGSFLSNTREEADTSKALSGLNILLEGQLVRLLYLCSDATGGDVYALAATGLQHALPHRGLRQDRKRPAVLRG